MNDFLNENNFEEIVLRKLFPEENWIHNKKIPNSAINSRPDFRNDNLMLIVEFDGYRHYTQCKVFFKDRDNQAEYERLGYKVIRWPYWIQPNERTTAILFNGFNCNFKQHFIDDKSGFVSKVQSCILPEDFCEAGLVRFYNQIFEFDDETIKEVIYSIIERNLDDFYIDSGDLLYFYVEKEKAKKNIRKFNQAYNKLVQNYHAKK